MKLQQSSQLWATAEDVPGWLIKGQHTLHGTVDKVTDGDTLRVRHTPFRLLPRTPYSGKLWHGKR